MGGLHIGVVLKSVRSIAWVVVRNLMGGVDHSLAMVLLECAVCDFGLVMVSIRASTIMTGDFLPLKFSGIQILPVGP